jgi:hypothetical protein
MRRFLAANAITAGIAAVLAVLFAGTASAADPLAECKAFFEKFEKCVDGLKGDQQDEARIFMKTLRGTVGLSDDLNRGDPTMTSIMCAGTMQEVKKEPMVQKYNCAW